MIKFVLIVFLLFISQCSDIGQGKKSKKMSGPENAATVLLMDATLAPIPFRGSCTIPGNTENTCYNYYLKGSQGGCPSPSKCESKNLVGVCVVKYSMAVRENIYNSPQFSEDTARQACEIIRKREEQSGGSVKFSSEYNVDSVYFPLR